MTKRIGLIVNPTSDKGRGGALGLQVAALLKAGRLRGLVATSTLELGIDRGSIAAVAKWRSAARLR